jgi:hypothetical protein
MQNKTNSPSKFGSASRDIALYMQESEFKPQTLHLFTLSESTLTLNWESKLKLKTQNQFLID